jgi:hypothetical protein
MDLRPDWQQELEARQRRTLAISADLLASEQRIDELEATVEATDDPIVREQLRAVIMQLRQSNAMAHDLNALSDAISDLSGALLALADRMGPGQSGPPRG